MTYTGTASYILLEVTLCLLSLVFFLVVFPSVKLSSVYICCLIHSLACTCKKISAYSIVNQPIVGCNTVTVQVFASALYATDINTRLIFDLYTVCSV